jgi:protein-export membrane protein SecD
MSRRRLWLSLIGFLAITFGSFAIVLALGWTPKLGLDLQGGFQVVLTAPPGTDPAVLDKSVEIMRRRIENVGNVQEPVITVQGERRILVQLPGVQDQERALQAVGETGQLSFRPVLDADIISPAFTNGVLPLPEEFLDDTTSTTSTTAVLAIPENLDPDTGLTIVDDVTTLAYLNSTEGLVYWVDGAFLTGSDITDATAQFTGTSGSGWVVVPEFTSDGAVKFEAATAELSLFAVGDPRRQLAIVVDESVESAPQIAPDVAPGVGLDANQVVITVGGQEEAEDLATLLRYGALPTTFEREQQTSVSATLGEDSLRAGLIAGIGGLILVALALMVYYRALGFVAVLGLGVFGTLLITVLILLGQFQGTTLTLAGVTGIIVSIGITADSYIVYFERIKEEFHRGRPLRAAVDGSFPRAFRTILTGDFVTFSGAILLWALAIGSVKAFAITLGIATVIDVIVAYFYTRPAVALMVRGPLGDGGFWSIRGAMGTKSEAEPAQAFEEVSA